MTTKEQYRDLCKQANDLPIFLKDWWLDAVGAYWDVAITMNGTKPAGVWPYTEEKKAGVTIFRNPVLTPYLSPWFFPPADLKPSKRDSFESETLADLFTKMPASKVWAVGMWPGLKQVSFFKAAGFDVQVRQTFIMPLLEDESGIFSRLHEDYRRNIRKADAETQIVNDAAQLEQLYEYQKATLDRKDVGMHYSMAQLQTIFDACTVHDNTALWVAKKEDKIQAILWHIWDNKRAYYLVGSKNPEVKDNRAMTALMWHAIKESKKMGKISFDFEGSMDPGVERFFRNFGGERELYLGLHKNESLLWKVKNMIKR